MSPLIISVLLISCSSVLSLPLTIQQLVPARTDVNEFIFEGPELQAESRPHHLYIGKCRNEDSILHSETIIINNDGTSRTAGDIRINVEAEVFITCVTVTDQMQDGVSGAYPSYLSGGVGYNYVILGFKTAYGYGANFFVEIRGTTTPMLNL